MRRTARRGCCRRVVVALEEREPTVTLRGRRLWPTRPSSHASAPSTRMYSSLSSAMTYQSGRSGSVKQRLLPALDAPLPLPLARQPFRGDLPRVATSRPQKRVYRRYHSVPPESHHREVPGECESRCPCLPRRQLQGHRDRATGLLVGPGGRLVVHAVERAVGTEVGPQLAVGDRIEPGARGDSCAILGVRDDRELAGCPSVQTRHIEHDPPRSPSRAQTSEGAFRRFRGGLVEGLPAEHQAHPECPVGRVLDRPFEQPERVARRPVVCGSTGLIWAWVSRTGRASQSYSATHAGTTRDRYPRPPAGPGPNRAGRSSGGGQDVRRSGRDLVRGCREHRERAGWHRPEHGGARSRRCQRTKSPPWVRPMLPLPIPPMGTPPTARRRSSAGRPGHGPTSASPTPRGHDQAAGWVPQRRPPGVRTWVRDVRGPARRVPRSRENRPHPRRSGGRSTSSRPWTGYAIGAERTRVDLRGPRGELRLDPRPTTVERRDGREEHPGVPVDGVPEDRAVSPISTIAPRDRISAVADVVAQGQVVGDEQHPEPRALRSPSRFRTSILVDASSMLITSSATRKRMSSNRARAISSRCSWPPLSWWGYLCRTWPGRG